MLENFRANVLKRPGRRRSKHCILRTYSNVIYFVVNCQNYRKTKSETEQSINLKENLQRRRQRRIWSFHAVVLQRAAKNESRFITHVHSHCTVHEIFCSVIIVVAVAVAVAVVVFLRVKLPLITSTSRALIRDLYFYGFPRNGARWVPVI